MIRIVLSTEDKTLKIEDGPESIFDIREVLKRSDEHDGIIKDFTLPLKFLKDGRALIRDEYEAHGIEAFIKATIYEYDTDLRKWDLLYIGRIQMMNYDIDDEFVSIGIERSDFQSTFLNGVKKEINPEDPITLNGFEGDDYSLQAQDLPLHSKLIIKGGRGEGTEGFERSGTAQVYSPYYLKLGGPNVVTNEFEKGFFNIGPWSSAVPVDDKNYFIEVTEEGDYDLTFNIDMEVAFNRIHNDVNEDSTYILEPSSYTIGLYYADNKGLSTKLEEVTIPQGNFTYEAAPQAIVTSGGGSFPCQQDKAYASFSYFNTVNMANRQIGDEGYLYIKFEVEVSFLGGVIFPINYWARFDPTHYVELSGETIFRPTITKALMIFETLSAITQAITGKADRLESSFFGREDSFPRSYDEDGPGSMVSVTGGRKVRILDNQDMALSWDKIFQSMDTIYPLGFGFVFREDGSEAVLIESKDFFYNPNIITLDLGRVGKVRKRVDQKKHYAGVKIEYPKLDIDQSNSIDEFNSSRELSTALTQTREILTLIVGCRVSGYELENTRRASQEPTKSNKLDEDIFLISVVRDGVSFKPRTDEDLLNSTNLIDPPSVYNLIFSPGRALKRWAKWIVAGLIRGSTNLKFTSGTDNYKMTSQILGEPEIINEGADLLITEKPVYYAEIYSFEKEITRAEMKLIRANPYGKIRFTDKYGVTRDGFLHEIERNVYERKASFKLIGVYSG